MIAMMKKYHFIRYTLFSMITLSFYLSYLIWISPVSRDTNLTNEENQNVTINPQSLKKASEIFQPLRVAKVTDGAIVETRSESFIKQVQAVLSTGSYQSLTVEEFHSTKEFLNETTLKNGFELSYIAPFSLNEYENIYDLDLKIDRRNEQNDFDFLSIQLDTDDQKIRFLNTKTHQIAEAKMKFNEEEIKELLLVDNIEWTPMVLDEGMEQKRFYTKEPMKLKTYSYIASTQPYIVYRDAFFEKPQEVRTSDENSDLVMYDGSENMTINEKEKVVEYKNSNQTIAENPTLYYQSYEYVKRLGANFPTLRFFDIVDDTINYRTFVEGYPVFGSDLSGQISVKIKPNNGQTQATTILTSLNTIQVPIPSEKTIELPASQVVVEELYLKGATHEALKAAIIGYRWTDIQDTGVVDLHPEWYLKYGDVWYSYDELLAHLAKAGEHSSEF